MEPINKLTAIVLKSKSKYNSEFPNTTTVCSLVPLPTVPYPKNSPVKDDLTGRKLPNITVIGYSLFRASQNRARWVCRCKCGRYTVFSAKRIKSNSSEAMCPECHKNAKRTKQFN